MNRNISDQDIVSKHFPELFHYTTVSTFENIYKTQSFWASHYEGMNDSTEFTRFSNIVQDSIRPLIRTQFDKRIKWDTETAADIAKRGIDNIVNNEAKNLLSEVHRHTFNEHMYKETFVVSFCAHEQSSYEAENGLLSQWRGYSAVDGVAIVFDTASIETMMQCVADIFHLTLIHLSRVIYDNEDIKKIQDEYKDVFNVFPEIVKKLYPDKEDCKIQNLEPLFEKNYKHFVLGSTSVKHHAFREENEIRIVVSPRTNDSYAEPDTTKQLKEIRYRKVGGRETRYIALFGHMPLPIKRIIIGPSRFQNINRQKIMDIVQHDSSIDVIPSDIPFLF